jgi:hypothetical protein
VREKDESMKKLEKEIDENNKYKIKFEAKIKDM